MIYFTSDHHFNHPNIIKLCNRPFDSIEAMHRALVERWNSTVNDGDTVFHLGDFCLGGINSYNEWVGQLRGNIRFIKGNHDKRWLKLWKETSDRVKVLEPIHVEKFQGVEIVMCHYPMQEWEGFYRGTWHLHGHCHNNLKTVLPNRLDVGIDCFDYNLVSLQDITTAKMMLEKNKE